MSILPSPPPNASQTQRGVVSTGTQTFGGAKTFAASLTAAVEAVTSLVRAVGASLVLRSSLGAGASDVAVKVGTSETNASVNAAAELFVVAAGIGGAEVKSLRVLKGGQMLGGSGVLTLNDSVGAQIRYSSSSVTCAGGGVQITGGAELNIFGTAKVQTNGRLDQSGTDSSGTPGAATINKPSGKSAIASGATSVRITNSLVAAGDQVHVTWHGDHGQTRDWVTTGAGFFDVNLNAAASANTAFCWTVGKRL